MKDFGDGVVNYYYNRGNIILETDKNNMATASNIRGLRLIYRENNPGQVDSQFLYYIHNAHGDVTQLLNEKGQLIKDYRYDTFGQEEMPEAQVFGGKQTGELWRQEVEKIDNPFRYCGEYLDEETGNYYLRARYYDPSIQRFVNEDSYGVEKGAAWLEHLYGYAGNNPIKFIDPSGHAYWFGFFNTYVAQTRMSQLDKMIADCGKAYNKTSSASERNALHATADQYRIERAQIMFWDPRISERTAASYQADVDRIRKEHGWTYGQTQFFNPKKGVDPRGITAWGNQKIVGVPVQGTGQTAPKAPSVTTNRSNNSNREAVKSGATDVAWYGADGAIEQGAKALGKTVSSQFGNVYSGVTTAFDVTKTWDNNKYTTGQKVGKITIQVVGGGANVAFGTVVGGAAIGAAPETGGASIVGGAAVIGGFSYGVNRAQNWLYDQFGLQ